MFTGAASKPAIVLSAVQVLFLLSCLHMPLIRSIPVTVNNPVNGAFLPTCGVPSTDKIVHQKQAFNGTVEYRGRDDKQRSGGKRSSLPRNRAT